MTVESMGNAARNSGERVISIAVFEETEHEQFTRHGDDVLYELPISFVTAALGGEVTIPVIGGTTELKIPAGTQSGKVLKLRGQGIPHLHHTGKGDQLVQITVWVPTKLSGDDKKLLRQLARSDQFQPPKASKSFFDRFRETLGV